MTSHEPLDPIAEARLQALDDAVADLRDFTARARRLRLQFDFAKQEELTAYRKVQGCQESLAHCYANNPFGGMNDIIERRKAQLAEAERAWQETTLYAAQLRSEVAEISEMEMLRYTPEVAQRMREQDGQELACANEMIVDGTTNENAPKSLEAIKIVAKEGDIRTAMVYGSPDGRPLTAADRTLALSQASPSRLGGAAGRGLPQISAAGIDSSANASSLALVVAGSPSSSVARHRPASAASPNAGALTTPQSPSRALPFALSPVRSSAGERIGSAIVATATDTSPSRLRGGRPHSSSLLHSHSETATSGLRRAAAAAGVTPGAEHRRLPSAIRGTAQSPLTMASVNFRESDQHAVVVARPGHYAEQSALVASDDSAAGVLGSVNHRSALGDSSGTVAESTDPEAYRRMINGQLPQIPLSPAQQRALSHSPFFRPGSAIIYAAADAGAARAQRSDNLDNSKPIALAPQSIGRDRRPLAKPAYYASPAAERVKYSITTPNTPLTEAELSELFASLDADGDGMLTMVEVAVHFDHVGTFGIANHSKTFIETNLRRAFTVDALVSYDEFAFLVAKWGTL